MKLTILVVVFQTRPHSVVFALAEQKDQSGEELLHHATVGQIDGGFLEFGFAGFPGVDGKRQVKRRRRGLKGRDFDNGLAAAAEEVAEVAAELVGKGLGIGKPRLRLRRRKVISRRWSMGAVCEKRGHEPGDSGIAHRICSRT